MVAVFADCHVVVLLLGLIAGPPLLSRRLTKPHDKPPGA
jgi:hypothetical protein